MVIWLSLFIFYNSRCVLLIPECDLDIPVCFFHNSGWVLFILDCHLAITVYLLGEHSAARLRTQYGKVP